MIADIKKLDRRWLALQVRGGWEIRSGYALTERGYEQFVPVFQEKRRWSDRTKIVQVPLFTGYVFLQFNARNPQPILSVPGVIRFVGMGNSPLAINDDEIEALQIVSKAAVTCGPTALMQAGQEIEVRSGPLAGLRGTVVRVKNRQRLVITVSLLQKSVFVEIDGHEVTAVKRATESDDKTPGSDSMCNNLLPASNQT